MTAAAKITAMGLADRAKRAAKVASEFADKVDVEGRFPVEGMNALKAERLMGVMIRPEFGGEGATLTEIADVCAILGQACAATAMHARALALGDGGTLSTAEIGQRMALHSKILDSLHQRSPGHYGADGRPAAGASRLNVSA